ncbi:MAG: LemA family protein [Rubrivivax sp.]
MSMEQLLVGGIAALLFFWVLGAHNRVVALRSAIGAAWLQVDAALQQRAAAVAALLSGLRLHLPQQQDKLDAVLVAQSRVQAAADTMRPRPTHAAHAQSLLQADASLTDALASVSVLFDTHEALREDEALAARLAVLHEATPRLAFARQLFNDAARVYNAAARQFPTRLLSRLFGFAPAGEL